MDNKKIKAKIIDIIKNDPQVFYLVKNEIGVNYSVAPVKAIIIDKYINKYFNIKFSGAIPYMNYYKI